MAEVNNEVVVFLRHRRHRRLPNDGQRRYFFEHSDGWSTSSVGDQTLNAFSFTTLEARWL
jgi:hypothetical protein